MTPEQYLYDTLRNDAGVTAIASDRIFSDQTPEDVSLPCLVIARVGSAEFETALSGEVLAERVAQEVHCFSTSRSGAEALCDAVVQAIESARFEPTNRVGEQDKASEEDIELTILSLERWHC